MNHPDNNGTPAAPPPPVPPLQNWTVISPNGKEERILANAYHTLQDGSILFLDVNGPVVQYNPRHWKKVSRSAIQPAVGKA